MSVLKPQVKEAGKRSSMAWPRAFTTHKYPDSSLLSSELGGSSATSSAGKLPPAPALGGSTSTCSNTRSQPLLLVPAKPSSQPLLFFCVSPALPCSSAAKILPAPSSLVAAPASWHKHSAHDWHTGDWLSQTCTKGSHLCHSPARY